MAEPHAPSTAPAFTARERERYARHLILPEVGPEGQERLRNSRALLVGAGGLGSPAALYLAAAGVGRITLVDFDRVDRSNLQRQVLFGEPELGRLKVEAARDRLSALNPDVQIEIVPTAFGESNAAELVAGADVVVDGADNFPTRYLVADACVLGGKPNVHGAIFRFDGQLSVFWPPHGPCYRCLFPTPPDGDAVPNCAEAGVLGVLPGVIGSLQAMEALKILLRIGEPSVGRLLLYDALSATFRTVKAKPNPQCPLCGPNATIKELREIQMESCPTPASATSGPHADIGVDELHRRRLAGEEIALVDVRQPNEWAICRIAGSTLLALGDVPSRFNEFDPERELVVHCKSGVRSAQAAAFLRAQGFTNVRNLAGGILAWIDRIEPQLPRY